MTIFSETCVVAHICSPRTLVQGQESQSQQSQPGLNSKTWPHPGDVCTPILLQLL